jgi:hypothetical protein
MRAIEIARNQQTRTFELRAALSLAKLYQTTGRDHVASELLVPALVGFNAGSKVPEVEEAQRLLTMHEPESVQVGYRRRSGCAGATAGAAEFDPNRT